MPTPWAGSQSKPGNEDTTSDKPPPSQTTDNWSASRCGESAYGKCGSTKPGSSQTHASCYTEPRSSTNSQDKRDNKPYQRSAFGVEKTWPQTNSGGLWDSNQQAGATENAIASTSSGC